MTVSTIYLRTMFEVGRFASQETTRYYLNGVYLENHDGFSLYVATDGHTLIVRRIVDEAIKPIGNVIIPSDVVNHWRFAKKDDDLKAAIVSQSEGNFAIMDGTITRIFKGVEGTYPDWRRVVPALVTGEAGQFNWDYMVRFAKFGKAFGIGQGLLVPNGTNEPALIRYSDPDAFGVLMPMRADTPAKEPPLWLRETSTKKAA